MLVSASRSVIGRTDDTTASASRRVVLSRNRLAATVRSRVGLVRFPYLNLCLMGGAVAARRFLGTSSWRGEGCNRQLLEKLLELRAAAVDVEVGLDPTTGREAVEQEHHVHALPLGHVRQGFD